VLIKIYKPFVLLLAAMYLLGLYFFLSNKLQQEKMGLRYAATLEQGIDFTKPGYPLFLKNVSGVSNPEVWGRWSDAKDAGAKVIFEFNDPLPKQFTLELALKAYGPNQAEPIKVIVGKTVAQFSFDPQLPGDEVQKISIGITQSPDTPLARSIELVVPKPTAPPKPADFNPSNPGNVDQRLLGIGFTNLSIN
jgi:phosphoglycerol transferase